MVRTDRRSRHDHQIVPNPHLSVIRVLGSVPGMIRRYALSDEQTLLAILRYNRLIDVFTQSTCYSLQSHLRTFMPGIGDVETDEIYVGVSMTGGRFVFPVQAKGLKDSIGTIQVEQDFAVCASKFPTLTCRPIAAQSMDDGQIALFELTLFEGEVSIKEEKHYRLVRDEDLGDEEVV
jgi:hypothetical protein